MTTSSRRSGSTTMILRLCTVLLISISLIELASCQQDQQQPDNGHHGGLFSTLLYPLRATIKQARNFLGNPVGNVYNGVHQGVDSVYNGVNHGVDMVRMESFKMFMRLYNKTYSPEEIPRRMALFFDRREEIQASVKAFTEGRLPFMMRENPFVDMDEEELKTLTGVSPPTRLDELTPEELEAMQRDNEVHDDDLSKQLNKSLSDYGASVKACNRRRRSRRSSGGDNDLDDDGELSGANLTVRADRIPARKDWRTSGCVGTPINQLKCGACYAIATIGVVETMRCLKQPSAPILAPQQIVDCSTPRAGYQNFGCDGGWPTRVLKYLQDVQVAAREVCYPFVRQQRVCRLREMQQREGCTVSANPSGSGPLSYKVLNNERDILYHVAKTGPVVTVMRATDKFLYYGSGIFDDPSCSRRRDDVDHAIVIVGYGNENGQDYWLIKNSWGTTSWGVNGYGKFRRGTNACSIGHWGWVLTS